MFQAQIDVVSMTTDETGDIYAVRINGRPFWVTESTPLRIGIAIERRADGAWTIVHQDFVIPE